MNQNRVKRKRLFSLRPRRKRKASLEEYFFVERIVTYDTEKKLFLIKWQGYNEETWEPESHLSPSLVVSFFEGTQLTATPSAASVTGARLQANDFPVQRLPVGEASTARLPADEVPAARLPAFEVPAARLPADEAPASRLPADEAPAARLPADEAPAARLPADEALAARLPADEAPAARLPAGEVPAPRLPADEAPAPRLPADEAPAARLSADDLPAAQSPAVLVRAARLPADEAPAARVPADEVPAVRLPADEAPAVRLPAGEVPTVRLPDDEAPAARLSADEVSTARLQADDVPTSAQTSDQRYAEESDSECLDDYDDDSADDPLYIPPALDSSDEEERVPASVTSEAYDRYPGLSAPPEGVMSVISFVGPVGVTVGGFILNMYTVAGLLGLAVYAAALVLFCVYYQESDIAVREEKLAEANAVPVPSASDPEEDLFPTQPSRTDYLAVAVCNLVGAHCYGWLQLPDTMMTPMAMDLYGWSEEHAVRRAGNILTLYGVLALAGFALSGKLAKRFPERGIMLSGSLMYLLGSLVMFPVTGPTPPMAGAVPVPGGGNDTLLEVNITTPRLLMSYRSPGGHAYVLNLAEGGRERRLQLRDLDPVTGRQLGCPASQTWCLTEPRPHLAQLIISFGLVMCATPFVLPMVNSCISKLLPAGNQSVMWGIVNGSANVGRLIYPLLNIYLYTFLGVRAQYGVMIGLCTICVALLLITYKRLKPRHTSEDKMPLTEARNAHYGATKADD